MQRFKPTWESIKTHTVPQWYEDCKLGIFIHWGLFSVPAYAPPSAELGAVPDDETWFCNNPYAEWYFNSVNVGKGPTYEHHIKTYGKDFAYENFADMWKAENWEPRKWAELFRKAGANYVVLVTKHHDGFCLFPSAYTEYNSTRRGPMRDITGELTSAVRQAGMKMGLYYSGIIDWRFAHDPMFCGEDVRLNNCPTHEYADYAYKQSMELIDRYHPSVFWNDIGWPYAGKENLPYLLAHYYNVCQDGVVNDRFNGWHKDFSTKEYQSGQANRREKWEMCRGLGLSFGYNAQEGEEHILSVEKLVSLLVSTVANNGNLLINVGPRADGTIPENQADKLRGLGEWLAVNGEAIYGTRCGSRENISTENGGIYFTEKEGQRFVILDGLKKGDTTLTIPGMEGRAIPLDASVQAESKETPDGLEVTVKNYDPGKCAAAFRVC